MHVNGATVAVLIMFNSTSSGTPVTDYIVIGVVVGVAAIAAVVLLLRRRGRQAPRDGMPPETGS